jgi:hypothetical protein
MVRWYLRNARVLRTWGALGGVFLPPLVALFLGADRASAGFGPVWIFVGYLVGALYAEVSLVRPVPAGPRRASLVPRELGDYLPPRILRLQRGLAVAAVTGGIAALLVPYAEDQSPPSTVAMALLAALAAAFAVILERLQRWLVARPQPFSDPELVAADDAIRAQGVHSLAGSGLAVLLLLVSAVWVGLAMSEVQLLRWTIWLPAVFGPLLALYACMWFGHRAWRVRRPASPPISTSLP